MKDQPTRTKGLYSRHIVAHKQHRPAMPGHILHLAEALLLKLGVADRQHLVDDQNLRLQMRRHREREPHIHAAGIALHRRIEEFLHFGEGDDLVELALDLGAAHAEDGAVEEDVLAARQLRVKAGADLEKARNAALDLDAARARLGDAREDLQQASTCRRRCGR